MQNEHTSYQKPDKQEMAARFLNGLRKTVAEAKMTNPQNEYIIVISGRFNDDVLSALVDAEGHWCDCGACQPFTPEHIQKLFRAEEVDGVLTRLIGCDVLISDEVSTESCHIIADTVEINSDSLAQMEAQRAQVQAMARSITSAMGIGGEAAPGSDLN